MLHLMHHSAGFRGAVLPIAGVRQRLMPEYNTTPHHTLSERFYGQMNDYWVDTILEAKPPVGERETRVAIISLLLCLKLGQLRRR